MADFMITILLATYNGASYIAEQIESLLKQTMPFDTLYIQDDCSTDNTWEILTEYQSKDPDRVVVAKNEKNTGNPKFNFYGMMSRIRDDYIMLCDQDDVWLPDKIEKTLVKMREMERVYGKDTPLLVHTDLRVVDGELKTINPSFKKAMNANYDRVQLKDQIIQNTLTGCTAMYNRAFAELIGERQPDYMVMHDWWMMLMASAFGHIGHIDDQTVLYRQHGANEIGAKDVRTLRYKIKKLFHYQEIKGALDGTYRQAQSLLQYYGDKLSSGQVALIEEYCDIPNRNKLQKWKAICNLGTFKNGLARNIAYFFFV
jgi:glycosyltransferase involved in cell wall biosynthesis